ncbi:hypothetical protein BDW22DRAFT_965269 [Trametopsis cervina]|nr:hypothetical protein BDW22DRAFT_965269 [Trametopsis cervina]
MNSCSHERTHPVWYSSARYCPSARGPASLYQHSPGCAYALPIRTAHVCIFSMSRWTCGCRPLEDITTPVVSCRAPHRRSRRQHP